MIRFRAQGAYLLLVPQGRALFQDRSLFLFGKQPNDQNKTLIRYLFTKRNNKRICNGNKYTVNVRLK